MNLMHPNHHCHCGHSHEGCCLPGMYHFWYNTMKCMPELTGDLTLSDLFLVYHNGEMFKYTGNNLALWLNSTGIFGDMHKDVYDPNNHGYVDHAEFADKADMANDSKLLQGLTVTAILNQAKGNLPNNSFVWDVTWASTNNSLEARYKTINPRTDASDEFTRTLPEATATNWGIVSPNLYSQFMSSGGGTSYVLPIASNSTLGGIKVGENLTINPQTGVLSAQAGGADVAAGAYIDVSGTTTKTIATNKSVVVNYDTSRERTKIYIGPLAGAPNPDANTLSFLFNDPNTLGSPIGESRVYTSEFIISVDPRRDVNPSFDLVSVVGAFLGVQNKPSAGYVTIDWGDGVIDKDLLVRDWYDASWNRHTEVTLSNGDKVEGTGIGCTIPHVYAADGLKEIKVRGTSNISAIKFNWGRTWDKISRTWIAGDSVEDQNHNVVKKIIKMQSTTIANLNEFMPKQSYWNGSVQTDSIQFEGGDMFSIDMPNCTSLVRAFKASVDTIPSHLFDGLTKVKSGSRLDLSQWIECSYGFSSINAGMFAGLNINGYALFSNTGITTIPSNLFTGMASVNNLGSAFRGTRWLIGIPSGLFGTADKKLNSPKLNMIFLQSAISTAPQGVFDYIEGINDANASIDIAGAFGCTSNLRSDINNMFPQASYDGVKIVGAHTLPADESYAYMQSGEWIVDPGLFSDWNTANGDKQTSGYTPEAASAVTGNIKTFIGKFTKIVPKQSQWKDAQGNEIKINNIVVTNGNGVTRAFAGWAGDTSSLTADEKLKWVNY